MTHRTRRGFLVAALAGSAGCAAPTAPSPESQATKSSPNTVSFQGNEIKAEDFDIKRLEYFDRPQWAVKPYHPIDCNIGVNNLDEIPNLSSTKSETDPSGHHPLRTTRSMLRVAHCYYETGDTEFRAKLHEMFSAVSEIGTTTDDGALYLPYLFKFEDTVGNVFSPGWYSGMAQGVGLSAYSRLYEKSGTSEDKARADALFKSITRLRSDVSGSTWVSCIDEDGHLWLEEYPATPSTHVLNGMAIGLWGVYDYWLATGSDRALRYLQGVSTSIRDTFDNWRSPGDISWYSHAQEYRSQAYHRLHIHQFKQLQNLTGDSAFGDISELLSEDYPVPESKDGTFNDNL